MKEIQLGKGLVAVVDDDDYDRVMVYRWHSHKGKNTHYARGSTYVNKKQIKFYLHRFIMNVTDKNIFVDHVDGNGLDCRKQNLRICNLSDNGGNSVSKNNRSGFKGVKTNIDKKTGTVYYAARIVKDRITYYLGSYKSAEDAAKAYDIFAIKLFGEFAKTNFPISNYSVT